MTTAARRHGRRPDDRGRPGPGLLEAVGWTIGFHVVQFGALAALLLTLLWCAAGRFPPTFQESLLIAADLGWESSFLFTGVASLAALLALAPAVCWRVGKNIRQEFGLRRLSSADLLWIGAAVVPLAVVSDQVYRWGLALTAWALPGAGGADGWPAVDALQIIERQMAETPYPVLLIAAALAPAVSEELVFRGLIGRGLIARWGAPLGMLLTSLLFAAAHGSPAHALATLPVGLGLHWVYRATGNLWSAVWLHGLVNGLSVTLMKLQSAATLPADPALLCAVVGYLAVVATQLRSGSRSTGDGAGVDSPGAGRRPSPRDGALADLGARLRNAAGPIGPALASCSILTYTCAVVWSRWLAW